MIFYILFSVSILAIIGISIYERKKASRNLLHTMIKSCNIDSVRFEKRLETCLKFTRNGALGMREVARGYLKKIAQFKASFVTLLKKSIRKKLYEKKEIKPMSDFIADIKD